MSRPIFAINRVYVKNSSFVAIDVPETFQLQGETNNHLELRINHQQLKELHHYEVILGIDVTSKVQEQELYRVNVEQAGIFRLENFPEDKLEKFLEVVCADRLYPYASNIVTQLTSNGTFVPTVLQPVDFAILYQEKQRAKQEQN